MLLGVLLQAGGARGVHQMSLPLVPKLVRAGSSGASQAAPSTGRDDLPREGEGELIVRVSRSVRPCFPPRLPRPSPRTKWTRRVPHPVLIGHAL
jgi:hypothetical protein